MTRILTALIRAYQILISPLLPPNRCRFSPSCSHYGLAALKAHGPILGSLLTLWRILRCNPWGGFGPDPVPEKLTWPALRLPLLRRPALRR